MKTIVLAAIAALPFSAFAQQADKFPPFADNGVYLSGTDFSNHKLTDGFDDGQPGYRLRDETFQRGIKIDQPNAPEAKIPLTDLWGERKQGVDYRSFEGDFYRVEHTDRIFIYSKPANSWLTGGGPAYPATLYYFSREANSPIHLITSENLKDIYYDQADKTAVFDTIDDLGNKPADQARKLLRLFYSNDNNSASHAAS
ncbi:hypothetical protein G8759_29295 [Spirosoma aureum]|uniref:Uncharacterized protein n=1 Tax=Spirosoma aureum TaxID=2692134 RepID=A0A6G9AVU4_9BACT|nr:hypothetical protein [Spirosoma aureum]QIP16449.1 hypothetical protein G8759_29295 [Spirosoma aureum]